MFKFVFECQKLIIFALKSVSTAKGFLYQFHEFSSEFIHCTINGLAMAVNLLVIKSPCYEKLL